MILWKHRIRPGKRKAFERAYAARGRWTELFRKGRGYRGTILLRDLKQRNRYATIDTWKDLESYLQFKQRFAKEYAALDKECRAFMRRERCIGCFESRAR